MHLSCNQLSSFCCFCFPVLLAVLERRSLAKSKHHNCEQCGKLFTTKGNLKIHQTIHTEETPYHCHLCESKFKRNADLKQHQRIHTGEKPYGCDECGKRFTRMWHLKTHQRIHTGDKPYGCAQCGQHFSLKNLALHLENVADPWSSLTPHMLLA